jgi:hypothetical protein
VIVEQRLIASIVASAFGLLASIVFSWAAIDPLRGTSRLVLCSSSARQRGCWRPDASVV